MKVSSETQRSSSTHSCLIIAICAAGPPQARQPNLRKRRKIEAGESGMAAAASSPIKPSMGRLPSSITGSHTYRDISTGETTVEVFAMADATSPPGTEATQQTESPEVREKAQEVAGQAQEKAQEAAGQAQDMMREQVDQRSTEAGRKDQRDRAGPAQRRRGAAQPGEGDAGQVRRPGRRADRAGRLLPERVRRRPPALRRGGLRAAPAAGRACRGPGDRHGRGPLPQGVQPQPLPQPHRVGRPPRELGTSTAAVAGSWRGR